MNHYQRMMAVAAMVQDYVERDAQTTQFSHFTRIIRLKYGVSQNVIKKILHDDYKMRVIDDTIMPEGG